MDSAFVLLLLAHDFFCKTENTRGLHSARARSSVAAGAVPSKAGHRSPRSTLRASTTCHKTRPNPPLAMDYLQTSALEAVETFGTGSDGVGVGLELGDACAKRVKGFATQFTKRLESSETSVVNSSDALRGDVLNSVIMADANATSEIPALVRATTSATETATVRLADLQRNAQAAPALRLEMLELCAERRLRMERRYLQSAAPKEERYAREINRVLRH